MAAIPQDLDPTQLHAFLDKNPEATGWAFSRENRLNLARLGDADTTWCHQLPSFGSPYFQDNFPAEFLPTWIKIEDQGQIGSCAGNALTSAGEICERNEHAGQKYRQFSRLAAYQIGKRRDGIRGDGGMTIDSGVWYGTQHGFALESDYPYPNPPNYPGDKIGQNAFGSVFKIPSARVIRDLDSFMQWLTTNQGPIYIGMRWTKWCDADPNYITTFLGPQRNDRHGGGHAVFFYGWTTQQKTLCPFIWNSWSTRWGNRGRKAVFPAAIREMLSDNITTCVGFTWRRRPQPQDWSFWQYYRDWLTAT